MSGFVHLHLHSEYSLLDGACRIADIPARAAECGHTAVALTDHGNMYGAVAFYRACKAAGVKAIIGCEVYVSQTSRFDRNGGDHANHLVLLCKNEIGYKNLIELVSKGYTEGFYSKPRVDDELLSKHSEGLIALSACLAGRIPRLLSRGDYASACENAKKYAKIFGEDNFYIELQDHGIIEQRQILPQLLQLAEECSLPVVATNDCHYLRRADADTQAVMMCIQTNSVIADGRPMGFETDEFYYKTSEEMEALFSRYEGALENTVRIAERCNFDFNFDNTVLPAFDCPNGEDPRDYLRRLCFEGFSRRAANGDIDFTYGDENTYRERLEYELSVISEMGYADYFLIVQDYVNFAKSQSIPVGPGRGSGAGSLVAYCLGITDVDSIRFGLLFERFLNPERVSMPDIDIDFCYNRRGEVLDYIAKRYGSARVSQIITFGTLAAKAAIRDTGRVLGMSYSDVDAVAKLIPQELNITIEKAMKRKDLRELYESSESVRKLVDTARQLEGMPRNISVHAAGVVITEKAVSEYVPLSVSNGVTVTQFDMDTIAKLGLLKFDFLALRYLTIVDDACAQIKESDPDFDIESIPLDDSKTYKLISDGNTLGVFQLESAGMRSMLCELQPNCIDDILAAIALYRPGPMESIPKFIERRRDPSKIVYPSEKLRDVLSSTFGCIVYQEQVMSIFRILAGYTYGHADIVRRAMSKKKADVLEAERNSFVEGAVRNGMTEQDAEKLFDDIGSFANYAFNKSHAAAYAIISYRTAYLKAHYPKEYFAAMLTSVLGNPVKVAEYIAECSKAGIEVLPPDINESGRNFTVAGENIRFGLLALKNVGDQFVRSIIHERDGSPYKSFTDFVERISGGELNRRMIEPLIKSGAFDRLGVERGRLLAGYESYIDHINEKARSNISGQIDMFSMGGASSTNDSYEFPKAPALSLREKLMLEKECSGMYFSGHLIDSYSLSAEACRGVKLSELFERAENGDVGERDRVRVAGIISSLSRKTARNGDEMAFFTLEDRTNEIECVVFAKQYVTLSHMIHIDNAVCVEGNISIREDSAPKLLISRIVPLEDNTRFAAKHAVQEKTPEMTEIKKEEPTPVTTVKKEPTLYVRVPSLDSKECRKCENLAAIFPGIVKLVYYDKSTGKYVSRGSAIALTDFLFAEICTYVGKDNAVLK